jgi:hypothetical protein
MIAIGSAIKALKVAMSTRWRKEARDLRASDAMVNPSATAKVAFISSVNSVEPPIATSVSEMVRIMISVSLS